MGYRKIAQWLNENGGNLNANALKQTIYRVRQKYDLSDLEPDWSEFDGPEAIHRQFTNVVQFKEKIMN
jgi:hypothetical protein